MEKSASQSEIVDRQAATDEVVRRLVDYFHPLQIYLFGAEARGEAHPDSDLDFLVVLPDGAPRESWLDGGVYGQMRRIGLPLDIVTVRQTQFETERHWLMALPAIATREGRLLYDSLRHAA